MESKKVYIDRKLLFCLVMSNGGLRKGKIGYKFLFLVYFV